MLPRRANSNRLPEEGQHVAYREPPRFDVLGVRDITSHRR